MGRSLCGLLVAGVHSVAVYSRTRERAEELCVAGATWAPAAAATGADVVFTMVGFPSDVREVILGESGVLSALRPGGVIVDMTSSEPSLAPEIYEGCPVEGRRKRRRARFRW
jgi:3-hydroxyisobutyrate dehydrogenase